jgi:hypothetical protein
VGEVEWERARLFPVSGIGGADEQERRAASALLAVVQAVREFGRAITVPMGAPVGRLSAYIEVPFSDGDKKLRPDGLLQMISGARTWTALVEVKTGRHELIPGQIEDYLDVARKHKFDALLTISNQVVATPGVHPVPLSRAKTQAVRLFHLSWSQIRTEALMEQANKSVSDPDQAWILAEFIRYLEHPRSGALDFDDMGHSWVHVRDHARAGTLHPHDKGAAEVADLFGGLISFAAMRLSRELGTVVRPMVAQAQLRDPARYLQEAVSTLTETGRLQGALRVPAAVAPIKITADLRAGLIHCAVTVPVPREGRSATRVNWLVRQLKTAPGHLRIEASTAWQRAAGPPGPSARPGPIRNPCWTRPAMSCDPLRSRCPVTSARHAARATARLSAPCSPQSRTSTPMWSSTSSHGTWPPRKSGKASHLHPTSPFPARPPASGPMTWTP